MKNEILWISIELIVIILEVVYFIYFFNTRNKRFTDKKITFVSYVVFLILTIFLGEVTSKFYEQVLVNIMLMIILACVVYNETMKSNIIRVLIFFTTLLISDMITIEIIMLLSDNHSIDVQADRNILRLQGMILSRALTILILWIEKKIFDKKNMGITFYDMLFIVIPTCSNICILFAIYGFMNWNKNIISEELHILLILSLFILVSTICILVFSEHYFKIKQKQIEYEKAKNHLQCKYLYYENKNKIENEVRKMYHDMKQHLTYLERGDNKSKEYIKKINNKIKAYENYINSGNEILDTIISDKMTIAERENIRMECDIEFEEGYFLEPIDITCIFGNALDNCIEACLEIEDVSERFITIKSRCENGFILVKIVNSKKGELIYNGDKIETKKKNKNSHGFGLSNIKEAVLNYKGMFKLNEKEDLFELIITIPIS